MGQGNMGLIVQSGLSLGGPQGSPQGSASAGAWGGDFLMLLCALLWGADTLVGQSDLLQGEAASDTGGLSVKKDPALPLGPFQELPQQGPFRPAEEQGGEKAPLTQEGLKALWKELTMVLRQVSPKGSLGKRQALDEAQAQPQDALFVALQGLCQKLVNQGLVTPKEAQDFLKKTQEVLKIHPEIRSTLVSLLEGFKGEVFQGRPQGLKEAGKGRASVGKEGSLPEDALKDSKAEKVSLPSDLDKKEPNTTRIFSSPAEGPRKYVGETASEKRLRKENKIHVKLHGERVDFSRQDSRLKPREFSPQERPQSSFTIKAQGLDLGQGQNKETATLHHVSQAPHEASAEVNNLSAPTPPPREIVSGVEANVTRLTPAQVPAYVKELVLRPGRDGHHEARIKLEPPHLGEVHISLSIDRGEVKLLFTVEHPQAAQALHQELHHLARALNEAGLQLGGCEIGLGGGQSQPFQDQAPRQNWWTPGVLNPTSVVPEEERKPSLGQGLIDVRI